MKLYMLTYEYFSIYWESEFKILGVFKDKDTIENLIENMLKDPKFEEELSPPPLDGIEKHDFIITECELEKVL